MVGEHRYKMVIIIWLIKHLSEKSLTQLCLHSGFKKVVSVVREEFFDINLLAFKNEEVDNKEIEKLLINHLK